MSDGSTDKPLRYLGIFTSAHILQSKTVLFSEHYPSSHFVAFCLCGKIQLWKARKSSFPSKA